MLQTEGCFFKKADWLRVSVDCFYVPLIRVLQSSGFLSESIARTFDLSPPSAKISFSLGIY